MYYKPGPTNAYSSIQNITNDLWAGWLVRGMHKWGASVFIILMFLHMGRVFLFGAYKYPRELNWIIGVLLLALGLAEGFTGYLLPWDQTAYWATTVGINLNGTAPFLGPFIAQFLQGGTYIIGDTLSRFYAIHMLILPARSSALIGLHMYLVVRLGVTSPPWSKEAAGNGPLRAVQNGAGARAARGHGEAAAWLSDRVVERRQVFKQYKEDVKERGKPFFPYAMLHDTIMSLVVVAVIIGLAVVWKWSIPGNHTNTGLGLARQALRRPGRPGDDQLRPAARTGTSTSSSICCGSSSGRTRCARHGRDPDDPARAADRDAVHRRPRRAAPAPPPGGDGRGDPRRPLDGRSSPRRARPRRRRSAPS